MKSKTNFKFLLILAIVLGAMLLLGTTKVQASSINDYKCKIEKGDYIIYNNYFNTKDVNVEINKEEEREIIGISKENINLTTFNNIVNDLKNNKEEKLLIKIDNDITSAKLKDTSKNLEIIELNNNRYVAIDVIYREDCEKYMMLNFYSCTLEMTKGEITDTKTVDITCRYTNTDYFRCDVNVVSNTGVLYGRIYNTNGIIYGMGLQSIPAKLDLSKCYVEYLANTYIGETLKVDCLGNVPYVGKYGNQYKYKMSLKNVKIDTSSGYKIIHLADFSYKESFEVGSFELDPTYTINNEIYVEQTKTNTSTKLKFDLHGNFKGTLKAEEINKNDLIYNKVNEELEKYSKDNVYMNISNIYIEGGSFEGPLKLTFYVGEQYNGKYYNICHMKNWYYEFENFEGIVENGKIEIVVDSLSPFGISIFEKKTADNTNQEATKPTEPTTDKGEKDNTPTTNTISKEKDETPKTGTETINIIGYVLATTILSGAGIVALKKNLK